VYSAYIEFFIFICNKISSLDVCGSVHHSTIHKEKSNKMQQCSTIFIIPYLYEAQHVSGDTAHHQEPKTALAASGFSYV
jgi:hypothetical protein